MRTVARALGAAALVVATSLAHPLAGRAQTPHVPTGLAIAQTALAYRGAPYAWVGDTPATGFSCVGFTHYVFAQYGVWLPESVAVLALSYPYVAPRNLQPGDLLLFTNTDFAGWSHVAIYLGQGLIIGADNFIVGVHVDSIYEPYWYSHWSSSIRVLPM